MAPTLLRPAWICELEGPTNCHWCETHPRDVTITSTGAVHSTVSALLINRKFDRILENKSILWREISTLEISGK